jgi:anti-sigma B factor antagonist
LNVTYLDRAEGDPVIAVSGELDLTNAQELRAVVDAALVSGPTRLVFDLEGLEFVDSSGIAVMIYAANHVEEVELQRVSSIVERIIDATGLSAIFRVRRS